MPAPPDIDRQHAIEHAARALDRVHADPRRAAVPRGPAANRDDDVDAALVRERHPVRGVPDHDRGEPRRETEHVADADRRIVPAGSPAVLTVNTRRPRTGRRSAAVFTAASAAARAPFCSDTPRPRTWGPAELLGSPLRRKGWACGWPDGSSRTPSASGSCRHVRARSSTRRLPIGSRRQGRPSACTSGTTCSVIKLCTCGSCSNRSVCGLGWRTKEEACVHSTMS